MSRRTERPGVLIYFEIAPVLQELTDAQAGALLKSMIEYAQNGVEPQFNEAEIRVAWSFIKPRIDRDEERYNEICKKNSAKRKYSIYLKKCEGASLEPLPFEAFVVSVCQPQTKEEE